MKTLSKTRDIIEAVIDWLYIPFRKLIPQQTFRYALCGGSNTVLDIFLYFLTYNFILKKQVFNLGFIAISPHIASFLIVFPITFITGFMLSKYITFTESQIRGRIQLFRYGVTVFVCILLNYFLLKLFVEFFLFYPTPSKMLTAGIVVVYSYLSNKYYTFKIKKDKPIVNKQ
ncbi:MAG: phenylalanine 4-monooxygenase [Bacteroidetes bacterium RIFOXYA12_FULL_35_11]|nr:MAG: phenylalanine 4-monooxygenase [Bacteroidetes bacterium GWF2_35_48]OFY82897.1 MAG: phenylalanine 4-monooxygenase [Bacteroidetes bacterium RIFOXYA12_FULL_35_11]OFY95315.1 MAG: phenylalanine 4-monooxygenase [Bacteroidetes bacterium RIFOXYB2_FULL_35_7]OFY95798.1 MAG: phenylalanine 4-monooxygenase [Bacteroidetes bacterium RIFOXYC12_FULL_35_7]